MCGAIPPFSIVALSRNVKADIGPNSLPCKLTCMKRGCIRCPQDAPVIRPQVAAA